MTVDSLKSPQSIVRGPGIAPFLARLLLRTDRQFDNPWRSSDHTVARGCPNESALFPAVS
jgi:hypothetical protein